MFNFILADLKLNKIDERIAKEIIIKIPKNNNFDDTLDIPDILKDSEIDYAIYIGDKLFEQGRFLYSTLFYDYAINENRKNVSKYSKHLIGLYFKQSTSLRLIGKIDESYNLLNLSLLTTLIHYSYNSAELVTCLFNFISFAKFIGEDIEYNIYNEEVGIILPKLRSKIDGQNFLLLYLQYANGLITIGKEREYQYLKKIMNTETFVKQVLTEQNLIKDNKTKYIVLKKIDNIEFIYYVYYRLLIEMSPTKKDETYIALENHLLETETNEANKLLVDLYRDKIKHFIFQQYEQKVNESCDNYIQYVYDLYGKDTFYTCYLLNQMLSLFLDNMSMTDKFKENIVDIMNEILTFNNSYFKTNSFPKEELNYLHADVFHNVAVIALKISNNYELGMKSVDTCLVLYKNHLGKSSERFKKSFKLFSDYYKKNIKSDN
jgi:hypothetical protein